MVDNRRGSPDDHTDLERETYRSTFDWSDPDQPSIALAETIAEIRDDDPLAVEPLHTHLDTGALDTLFAGKGDHTGGSVVVTLDGHRIHIESQGRILAEPVPE